MPAPKIDFKTAEKYWDDAKVGDECTSLTCTVTAKRIDACAEFMGDFTLDARVPPPRILLVWTS